MPGRRPHPTSAKVLRGTFRKDRTNTKEPQPPARTPRRPTWLDAVAAEHWKVLVPILNRMKVLTSADGPALAAGCAAYSEYRAAYKVLSEQGQTYSVVTDSGTVHRKRPENEIAASAFQRYRSMLIEFGLTPAARTRVNARDPDDDKHDNVFAMLFGEEKASASDTAKRRRFFG